VKGQGRRARKLPFWARAALSECLPISPALPVCCTATNITTDERSHRSGVNTGRLWC